jgi:predicted dehydrogenase
MLRGAIIGFGNLAMHGHLPAWIARKDVSVVAAADLRRKAQVELAERLPGARWYDSVEELLNAEKLDFVDLCTPPDSHANLIRAALERSCHVLCEKPLVLKPGDLGPLAALAATRQRALVTVHNWIHSSALAKVTELLRSGVLGPLRRCRWETLRTEPAPAEGGTDNWRIDPARSGGGVLVDHGWHALYVVNSWLGRPKSVRAALTTRRHHAFRVEDTALVELDYGPASAEIFLTWAASERANRIEVEGTRGWLRLDGGKVSLEAPETTLREQNWELPSLAEGSHHPDWFRGVVEGFLAEVQDPRVRGGNLDEAARCVTLLSLAQESNRLGDALTVPGD